MRDKYLEPRQLEAFSSVMSVGSITGAAKVLGRSQSVITRLIQDLETELGFPLLHRNGPRIAPTEQGVKFYAEAELVLSGLRSISERAREIASESGGSIRISSTAALAAGIVPLALRRLGEMPLPPSVHLQSVSPEDAIRSVSLRMSDVGIASLPLDHPGLDVHWVAQAPCVAAVASGHPLAARDVISPRDLAGLSLILPANPYRQRLRIEKAFAEHGVTPGQCIDSNTTYVSLAAARMDLGVAIVESVTSVGLPVEGVRIVPLSFSIPFYWGVMTASAVPLSSLVQAFIATLKEVAQDAIPRCEVLSDHAPKCKPGRQAANDLS